jgi:hypothetical protein
LGQTVARVAVGLGKMFRSEARSPAGSSAGDPVHVAVNGICDGVKMRVIVESGSEGIIMQQTRSA